MKRINELVRSARPHLPAATLACWASVFFSLSVLALLVSLAVSQTFLAAAALCFAGHTWKNKPRVRFPPLGLPLALFCLWTVVSMFWAEHPAAGASSIRKLVLFVILLLAVNLVVSRKHLQFLCQGLVLAATVAGLVGLVQFVVQYERVRALHPDEIYFYMTLRRITGFMGHWMNFGGQQMLVFLLLAALVLSARLSQNPPQDRPPSSSRRMIRGIMLGIVALSILLNFTRGVWLGCFVAAIYLVARRRARWLWALPVLILLGYVAAPGLVRERVNFALHPSRDPALANRLEMWQAGLRMIERHPLVGVGPNNIIAVYPAYLRHGQTPIVGYHEHLHNNFLQLGAERGLPCLLAWVCLMAALGWHFVRIRRQLAAVNRPTWLADGVIAGWLAFLVEGCFEFNFGTSPVLMLFLFVATIPFILERLEADASTPKVASSKDAGDFLPASGS